MKIQVRTHKRVSKNKVTVVKQHSRKSKMADPFAAIRKSNSKSNKASLEKQRRIDSNEWDRRMGMAKAASIRTSKKAKMK